MALVGSLIGKHLLVNTTNLAAFLVSAKQPSVSRTRERRALRQVLGGVARPSGILLMPDASANGSQA